MQPPTGAAQDIRPAPHSRWASPASRCTRSGAAGSSADGSLDVDGNGQIDALTDGLVLMRAMFGLAGTAVTNGAIGGGTPTRSTWAVIQPYLNTNCGGKFAQ